MKTGADLEVTQETGDTALSLSSFFGRPGAVAELVRRGANVRCRDREGAAPGEVFEAEVDTATRRQIQVNQQHDTGLLGSLVCLPYLVAVWRWFLREQCLEVMWSVFFELFGHQQRLAQDRRKLSPDQQPPPETLSFRESGTSGRHTKTRQPSLRASSWPWFNPISARRQSGDGCA